MKQDDIYTLGRLLKQFQSLHEALSTISSDTPKEELGKLKMARINNLLDQANTFLNEPIRPFDDFTVFTGDNTAYSDAVLVVGQYVECLKAFRDLNVQHRYGKWFWVVDVEGDEAGETRYIAMNDTNDLDD